MAPAPTSASTLPPLPPGASLSAPPAAPAAPATPGVAHRVASAAYNLPGVQEGVGMVKGGMHTMAGLLTMFGTPDPMILKAAGYDANGNKNDLNSLVTGQHNTQPLVEPHIKAAADWLNAHAQDHGMWQHIGDFGESALELMTPEALGALGKVEGVVKGGEAAAKVGEVVSAAQKYADAAKVSKVLDSMPRIKALVMIGLRAAAKGAAEVGGQTLVKTGGDTDAALSAAETGAVAGGIGAPLLDAAGSAVSSAIARRATTIEDVGGVPTNVSAEARNARGTPQQVAGRASIKNAAQSTLADRLGEVNESRAVPEDTQPQLPARTGPFQFELKGPNTEMRTEGGGSATEPRKRQIGTQYVAGKGSGTAPKTEAYAGAGGFQYSPGEEALPPVSDAEPFGAKGHKEPVFQYLSGAKPGGEAPGTEVLGGGGTLRTQDPNIAKAHVANLNNLIDSPDFENMPPEQQAQIREARADAQQQLGRYHQEVRQNLPGYGKPNFPQIDIPKAIQRVGSYTDAANHLEGVATEGYNNIADSLGLNDISGGKFNTIRNANKAAWARYTGATSAEELHNAGLTVDETNRQMQDLLQDDIGGSVSDKELSGFNDAYGQAQKLKYVANAVDKAFSGNPSTSARSFEYRGFNGQTLMSNLNGLERKFGRSGLARVVGEDNLNTLYQVAELNRTNEARAKFGAAVAPVAKFLSMHATPAAIGAVVGARTGVGWEAGAAAGLAASYSQKRVMDAILTNPKVAQNLIFAIKSGARPENYGPLIGAMIQQNETENSNQRKAAEAGR